MIDLGAAYEEMVAGLVALGLRTVEDPRDLNPPCVILRDQSARPAFLSGDWEVVWQLDLVVGDAGTRANLTALSGLLATLTAGVPVDGVTRLDLILPGHPDPLPAYRCLLTTQVTED